MTRVGGDVDRLADLPGATSALLPPVRVAAARLDEALDRVRATTDPSFLPGTPGDGDDARRWTRAVAELDGWVAHVGHLLAEADTGALGLFGVVPTELALLAEAGLPALPTPTSSRDGTDGHDGLPPHPDVAAFDEVAADLDDAAMLAWWRGLSDPQRERLQRHRWAQLVGSSWLPSRTRDEVLALVRADLPVTTDVEDFGYRLGIGPLGFGTSYEVTQVLQHDGDVLVTIALSDTVVAALPERFGGEALDAELGGATGSSLTLRFADEAAAAAALDDFGRAFLPGQPLPEDPSLLDRFLQGFTVRDTPETAFELDHQIASLLEPYADHVVASDEVVRLSGGAQFRDLLEGGVGGTWSRDRLTGDLSRTLQLDVDATLPLPLEPTVSSELGGVRGDLAGSVSETTTVTAQGAPVSTTTVHTLTATAGRLEVDLGVLEASAGVEAGSSVVHTDTTLADGSRLQTLVLSDVEVRGGEVAVDPSSIDPRLPSLRVTGSSTTSETTRAWIREDGGPWTEVTG